MAEPLDPRGGDVDGLRQRNVPIHVQSDERARQTVLELNEQEEQSTKSEGDKKTYGRTPDGTVFTVPATRDMVSQLLSPTEPKNVSDVLVILVMALHGVLLWTLPEALRIPIFAAIFLFWRAGYNIGIGYLLHMQSHEKMLIRWSQKLKLFVDPSQNPHPGLFRFIKRELETKIPKNYKFEDAPLEYNTWLVFRRIVDLILMCDFTSYILFAFACANRPAGESAMITAVRWAAGTVLFLFNLWVKLDAHRVVKDFAWYWGDFFFLIDQELTFDGVFEMAPHPMYSIGYVGFYGISLMAASYKVLFLSIFAHAAQFAFLFWVENPHIERTYNAPPPRQRLSDTELTANHAASQRGEKEYWAKVNPKQPPSTHNLLGLGNIDFHRVTDSSIFLLQLLLLALTVLTPSSTFHHSLFVANAVLWRLWYSVGLGFILNRQSERKRWTRHFLKYGESTNEAWRQWKGIYHLSMTMCYTTFAAAAWKSYHLPPNWTYEMALLRHVLGFGLIAIQMWVSASIYEQLGEFGWFFGDFFYEQSPKLSYGGIYRFLNNPERVLGLAGVWGIALITLSKAMFFLALLSHVLSLAFIQFVERPHMQKLYGRHLRQDAGLVRSLRRSLPPHLRHWQEGVDKMLGDTFDFVDDFLDAARPKLAAGVNSIVRDTKDLFQKYPARISITRVEPETIGFNPRDYSVRIEGTAVSDVVESHRSSGKEEEHAGGLAERQDGYKSLVFEYGAPLRVKWTAPANHSKKDWIGLYMVAASGSREATQISSSGRWTATNPGEYDQETSEVGLVTWDVKEENESEGDPSLPTEGVSGEIVFAGDKLWWTQGAFEFRYHHNGKHNVMAISQPFEVRIPRLADEDLQVDDPDWDSTKSAAIQTEDMIRNQIEQRLLPLVQNCFDRDPEIAPRTAEETFGALVDRDGKFARRVVYVIQQMFGIEFAPEVVKADGKVSNLAWRIWEAKKVLAPYSMSTSKGTNTPLNSD